MKNTSVIYIACILHLYWGVALLISDIPLSITAINTGHSILRKILPIVNNDYLRYIESITLIVASVLTLWSRFTSDKINNSLINLLELIPQQVILIGSALGALVFSIKGEYADGTVLHPTWVDNFLHISSDQLVYLLLAIFHFIVVTKYFLSKE